MRAFALLALFLFSLNARSSALFFDDFSSGGMSHTQNGFAWVDYVNVTVEATNAAGSTHAARITFGPDQDGEDSNGGLRVAFGQAMPEFWAGYKIRIPANYFHRNQSHRALPEEQASNNMGWFTAWDAGGDSTFGSPHVGLSPTFWDNVDGTSSMSLYIWGQNAIADANWWPGQYPTYFPNGDGIIEQADLGELVEIVVHYKYATSANDDGIAQIWKRRGSGPWIKLLDVQNGSWFASGQDGFGTAMILGWSNSGYTQETVFYLSDFWIAVTDLAGAAQPPALFSDDFSSGDLGHTTNGFGWDGSTNVDVVATNVTGGTHAARFTFGPDLDGEDSTAELRIEFGQELPEFWAGYKVRIPANYFHRSQLHRPLEKEQASNNKGWFYAWDAGGDETYESPHVGMGPNFWDNADGTTKMSFYVWGQNQLHDHHFWPDAVPSNYPNGEGIIEQADLGELVEIVVHYKYATAADNDGVAEIWKRRGTGAWIKLLDIQDGNWYSIGQQGFGYGYLFGWANSGFEQETVFHVGDFWIAEQDLSGASN